jgi:hypothetical protein
MADLEQLHRYFEPIDFGDLVFELNADRRFLLLNQSSFACLVIL